MKTLPIRLITVWLIWICFAVQSASAELRIIQPNPTNSKDIWTTSVFSYQSGESRGPGGGLDNDLLIVGGWGDLYYSLIEFDLSDPTLPTLATSAVLRLYHGDSHAQTTPMYIDRITSFWDWRTQGTGSDFERLWFADRPTATLLPATSLRAEELPAPGVNQFYEVNITDLYNFWMASPTQNFGVMLRPKFNNNNFNAFYSSDQLDKSRRPSLVVVSDPANPVVSAIPLAVNPVPYSLPRPPQEPAQPPPPSSGPLCNYPRDPDQGEPFLTLYKCSERPFDPSRPTVVISHGWNLSGVLETPPWMNVMAEKIGGDANIFLWNWQEKAKTLSPPAELLGGCADNFGLSVFGCLVPFVNVPDSGNALGRAIDCLILSQEGGNCGLVAELAKDTKPSYSGKIHLVGHSLGSGVITYALDAMERYKPYVDQLSMLDSAFLTLPPGGMTLPSFQSRNGFVDNYRSLFSLIPGMQSWAYHPAFVDINVFLPNVEFGDAQDCLSPTVLGVEPHGYSHLWFTSSWQNFQCPSLLDDLDSPSDLRPYGTAWSAARNGAALRETSAPYYSSLSITSKWNLIGTVEPFSANLFSVFSELDFTGRAVGAFAQDLGAQFGQTVRLGGQAAANVVTVGINVVGDLGQVAAGGVTYALVETQRLSTEATAILVREAEAAAVKVKIKALNAFDRATDIADAAVDKAEHATAEFFSDLKGSLKLSLNSDAMIHMSQQVPVGTTVMRFSFEYLIADAGTLLEVFVDGIPAFSAHSSDYYGRGKILSEWINVAPFAGKTASLAFRLSNPAAGSHGVIRLDDLFFARITPTDAPYAVAVAPRLVRQGSKVALDGTWSSDLGGTLPSLTYHWSQLAGPEAAIQTERSPVANVTPTVKGQYQYALRVADESEITNPAVVSFTVPLLGDIDLDGDVDNADLNLVLSVRNQPAGGANDLRDLNGDGKIDALDARKLTTLCTRPRCATQ